jgi:4-hydroxy-tetrahydrodipicolinate synthase
MVTPFDSDGRVNYYEIERIADHLVDIQQNEAIVVCGTTGESPTLTDEEKLRVLESVLRTVGTKAAVIMGAGTYNTAESKRMVGEAQKRGAHGIMLVSPYYSKPGQDGLYAHFSTLAKETDLPVMVYNIQGRTGINIETPTLLKLAKISNIVAVKEASGDLNQISDVCAKVPEGFRVYSGDDGLFLPTLSVGGYGLVSVAAHVVGAQLKQMMSAYKFTPQKAAEINKKLLPIFRALFSAPSPTPVKYALSLSGFDCESVRLPLVQLNESQKAAIKAAMDSLAD